jgi:hypothetical protein
MSRFLRFIFTLIIAGVLVNLAIVLLANARSHADQDRQKAVERDRFNALTHSLDKQLRRGEMAVEWQRVDANHNVVETSLLLRQFMPHDDNPVPLPTVRVIIPGSRVCIDGLKLYFDPLFNEEYAQLRDTTLFYFAHVYADSVPKNERFTFIPLYEVPRATQVHATDKRPVPTYLENRLWQSLWPLIQNPAVAEKRGLKVTWIDPKCQVVKNGVLYKITVGLEGVTITEEDEALGRPEREEMLKEMSPQPTPEQPVFR